MTTRTATEACGRCRQPVELTRWTERSRHTGRALCDRCSGGPAPVFEARDLPPMPAYNRCDSCGRIRPVADLHKVADHHYCTNCVARGSYATPPGMRSLPRMGFGECVRCRDPLLNVPGLTAVADRSGGPVCSQCADSGRIELRYQAPLTTPESSRRHHEQIMANRQKLIDAGVDVDGELRALMAAADAELRGYEDDHEDRDVDLDDVGHDAWGDTGAEVRDISSTGDLLYGEEPDGELRPGRWYRERWWVRGVAPLSENRSKPCECGNCDGLGEVR